MGLKLEFLLDFIVKKIVADTVNDILIKKSQKENMFNFTTPKSNIIHMVFISFNQVPTIINNENQPYIILNTKFLVKNYQKKDLEENKVIDEISIFSNPLIISSFIMGNFVN